MCLLCWLFCVSQGFNLDVSFSLRQPQGLFDGILFCAGYVCTEGSGEPSSAAHVSWLLTLRVLCMQTHTPATLRWMQRERAASSTTTSV